MKLIQTEKKKREKEKYTEVSQKQWRETHLSPKEPSCTSPISSPRWLPDVPWQLDTPWARPTCLSYSGRRDPNSRPSVRWLFAGYLRRCSHLLVIGMYHACLRNRTVNQSIDRSLESTETHSHQFVRLRRCHVSCYICCTSA